MTWTAVRQQKTFILSGHTSKLEEQKEFGFKAIFIAHSNTFLNLESRPGMSESFKYIANVNTLVRHQMT